MMETHERGISYFVSFGDQSKQIKSAIEVNEKLSIFNEIK